MRYPGRRQGLSRTKTANWTTGSIIILTKSMLMCGLLQCGSPRATDATHLLAKIAKPHLMEHTASTADCLSIVCAIHRVFVSGDRLRDKY
ncbi:hypothetical protein M433DRAFT_494493 [Acidomyces richmondensis BFW]|nr:hypothetical protein M433DRAFT_494493 [Acidomyces richmondensis BFW]